jgi:hypothetical protein
LWQDKTEVLREKQPHCQLVDDELKIHKIMLKPAWFRKEDWLLRNDDKQSLKLLRQDLQHT